MPCNDPPWSEAEVKVYEIQRFLGIMENVGHGANVRVDGCGLEQMATEMTKRLCRHLRGLGDAGRRKLYAKLREYDCKSEYSFSDHAQLVKKWWRKHKLWDDTRVEIEETGRLRRSARAKLTKAEREALGL